MDSNNNNWQEMPYQGTENNTGAEQTTTYDYTDSSSGYTAAPPQYNYGYQAPAADTKDGLCVAALVLGIAGFFVNPLYVCSILSIIFGVIGHKANGPQAKQGQIGMILGIVSLGIQFMADLLITIFSFGAGVFTFCC